MELQQAKELVQGMFALHAQKQGLDPHIALINNRAALAVMDAFVAYLTRPSALTDDAVDMTAPTE